MFGKLLNPKAITSIKRKSRSPFLESFQLSPKKQNNDASQPKNSKQAKSPPRQQFNDRDQQWNKFSTSMPTSSYELPMHMPCGHYFSMPYFCPACSYNSWMSSPPRYFCPDYITNKEPVINESSPADNDRFHCRNRSTQRNIR